jgi:UrcA family protein
MTGSRPSRDRPQQAVHTTLIEPERRNFFPKAHPEEENIMFKTTMFVAAALCTVGLFSAPAAFAATTEVRYKDLDLTTTDGQQQLQSRIEKAAREVCRVNRASTGTHLTSTVDRQCYKQAMTQVRDQVASAVDNSRLGG